MDVLLKTEANYYYGSSRVLLESNPKYMMMAKLLSQEPNYQAIQKFPFNIQIGIICKWVRDAIVRQNDTGRNNVVLWVALATKAFEIAGNPHSFKETYIALYVDYYTRFGDEH